MRLFSKWLWVCGLAACFTQAAQAQNTTLPAHPHKSGAAAHPTRAAAVPERWCHYLSLTGTTMTPLGDIRLRISGLIHAQLATAFLSGDQGIRGDTIATANAQVAS